MRNLALIGLAGLAACASSGASAPQPPPPPPAAFPERRSTTLPLKVPPQLDETYYFAPGQRTLASMNGPLLDLDGAILGNYSFLQLVEVAGHAADDEPDPDGLATARAEAVRAELLARHVGLERLVVRSYGATRPVCQECTEDCRARNRRVEFTILRRVKPEPTGVGQ